MAIKPARLVILSFLVVILLGTLLLSLPFATTRKLSFIDTLFTATSATCVTGLTVISVPYDLSKFGKIVVMVLFQLGGLGIMGFSTIFALILSRRITIKERQILSLTYGEATISFRKLLFLIFFFTLSFELISAVLLHLRWRNYNFFYAIFHAISAFCNAGFSLFPDSLNRFRSDFITNIIMGFLIITGGLGFLVVLDLISYFRNFSQRKRLTIHSKIVLATTVILILLGAVLLFFLEVNGYMSGFSFKEKTLVSFFQSITARTAGFSTIDINSLATASKFLLIAFMFIGASPGSTGGGIKTVTFIIVLSGIFSILRGEKGLSIFHRSIPLDIFRKAVVILFLSIFWIFMITLLLSVLEQFDLLNILFEVTSAFGTVGLSTGITSKLTALSKLVIILTMFLGRIGPLTLVIALGSREIQEFKYPEEKVMIG